MKKVFLGCFLFLSLSFLSFGVNTFELQYLTSTGNVVPTHSITRGGEDLVKVRLKITNPTGIVAGEYNFRSYQVSPIGFYIKNFSTTNTTDIDLSSEGNDILKIIVDANSSTTTIDVDMDIWVGQCFSFVVDGPNTILVNTPFSLVLNDDTPVAITKGNNVISVNKGGFLNYIQSVRIATPDDDKTVAFSYILVNNSTDDFIGNISFRESVVGSAYDIRQVNFYKWNGAAWLLITGYDNSKDNLKIGINNNDFFIDNAMNVSVNLAPDEEIKVEEIVRLNGCLQNAGTNESTPLLSWGNAEYNMCATPGQSIKSFITVQALEPKLVRTDVGLSDHKCFGRGENLRTYQIKNIGNDVAQNVMINLGVLEYFTTPFFIPFVENVNNDNNDIYLMVNDDKYIINFDKYTLGNNTIYSKDDHPSFVPDSYWSGGNEGWARSGFTLYNASYRDKVSSAIPINGFFTLDEIVAHFPFINKQSFPFSADCIGGFGTKTIKDIYIDEYKLAGSTGDFQKINIKPGDDIVLYWNEVSCCFKNEGISQDISSSFVVYQYDGLCGRKREGYLSENRTLVQHKLVPAPTSGTTLGDVDRCASTSDGLVERISATIARDGQGLFWTPGSYATRDGRIVFRLYLQNGLDLDKSLLKPMTWGWTQRGYDNIVDEKLFVQNNSSGCSTACTGPACDPNKTIMDEKDRFYVRLRPSSVIKDRFIIPESIKLIASDDSKVQNFGALLSSLGQPLNNELIFENNSLYANQLYEISFNVDDLLNFYSDNGGAVEVSNVNNLNKLLLESILDFDVRAYCSINGKPTYKVIMYHDRCTDPLPANQQNYCDAGYGTMQPISSFSNNIIINCPGCKIPGANIEISFLERTDDSKGLADLGGDRVPDNATDALRSGHPTLRNVAMGDTLVGTFQCYMSDGEQISTGEGVAKFELDNKAKAGNDNFYLDNVLINGVFSGAATNNNIEIQSVKMTYHNIEREYQLGDQNFASKVIYVGDKGFILRANVRDFDAGAETFDVGALNGISFELIYLVGDMGNANVISEITYAPYYTPCDDCTDLTVMTEVNPASNINFNPFTYEELTLLEEKTLWKCSGFSNKFKFIPYIQRSFYTPSGGNCVKSTKVSFEGKFNSDAAADFFEEEYRVFLKTDLKAEVLIPNGYIASEIRITNLFRINNQTYSEVYFITSPSIIDEVLVTDFSNSAYSQYCKLSLHYNPLVGPTTLVQNRTINDVFPDGVFASLTQGDEIYSVEINVFYSKDPGAKCSEIPDYKLYDIYNPTLFINKSNVPSSNGIYDALNIDNRIHANPNASLLSTANFIVGYTHSPGWVYKKPAANIVGLSLGSTTIDIKSSGLIEIPIRITNDKTTEGAVPEANFPYFQIYGDALTKGLKFLGVYQGNKSITNPVSSNYYSEFGSTSSDLLSEGIIVGVDQYLPNTFPVNGRPVWAATPMFYDAMNVPISRDFTLVFENTCPENCFQNIGCGTDNTLPQNCLLGNDNLKIAYGWSCGNIPTFEELNENRTCGEYPPINYTVNVAPVGLTVNTSINGKPITGDQPLEIEPCHVSNAYTVKLNSCKAAGFSEFEIGFSGISSEVSITGPASAGPFVVTQDAQNLNLFHLTCNSCTLANQTIDVNFIIKSSCKVVNENLITHVKSKTFCTPNAVPYVTLENPLQIKVNPSTSISDQISISNDVLVTNNNHLNISYTLTGKGSGVTKFDNKILVSIMDGTTSIYSESITIPSGTLDGIVTKDIPLGITTCGTYTAILTPQITYVPSCGIDINTGEIIPTCKNSINGLAVSKNVLLGSPIAASITTLDGYASFLCSSASKVTFVAYPQNAGLTYLWSGPGVVGSNTANTIDATAVGTYTVVVTNLCGSSTATANVVNNLQIVCPQPICPGEIPDIDVVNFNGVVGTYNAQWYNPNGTDGNTQADLEADILMDKGIVTSGYYYAATITPSCTLRTNARNPQACPITVKRAPNAYHITSDRPSGDASVLFLCDGEKTVLSVTDKSVNNAFPTDVIWRNGQVTLDDIVAPGTWTNPGNLLTAQDLGNSAYFIVAIDQETKCRTTSNAISIETPRIEILRTCEGGSGIKLTAVSNFNVMPDQYDWQMDGMPFVQATNTVDALQAGVYTVVEHSTGCALSNKCWGIKENLNTTAASNQELLTLQDAGFEGITATQTPLGFDTEFLPLDRTGYTGASLPADYTIGKFMINESGLQASDWSPNVPSSWVNTNTTYSGTGAMFIDGESEPTPKLIWGKTIPVTHGLNYLYRFNVRNISLLSNYPVEEIPELYAQITYIDDAGNGTRYRTNKQALFNNGQSPWIEFSSYSPAIPGSILNCLSPTEIQTVRLELFMDGGGSIGRDIAIDDVSLIPIGVCDDLVSLALPCNAALAELDNNQLVICPGTSAQFNLVNVPAGLTYLWQKSVNGNLMAVGTGTSFITPELNLIDPTKSEFFQYQVTVTDPINHCQTKLSAKAIVSALPKLTISQSWTGSNCEKQFNAVFDGLGAPTQFEWYVNDELISSESTNTYIVHDLKLNDVIKCNVNNVWCSGAAPVESNSIELLDVGMIANAGANKSICMGESVVIGTDEVIGASYSWLPLTDLDDATKAQPLFTQIGLESNITYTLTLTDLATGCVSSDEVDVVINTLPNLIITNPNPVCTPSSIDLTSAAITHGSDQGLTYAYFIDMNASDVLSNPSAVSVPGEYYIQAKNTVGCYANKPVTVDFNLAPVLVITNPALVIYPNVVDLTLPQITLGSSPSLNYSYFTDANAATPLAVPNAVAVSGTYYIKGTTIEGCSDVSPVEVAVEHSLSNVSSTGSMEVTLSPNPFSIQTYISVSGASSDFVKITIIDMNGKVIFENAHISNNQRTPIGMELSSAVYLLKVIDDDKIKIMKFVKL